MVEHNLLPTGGVMAHITRLIGRNMTGTLARCHCAIMTVFTTVGGLTVINGQSERTPAESRGMTPLAKIRGDRMGRRFVAGDGPSMADSATVRGLFVRERHDEGHPSPSGVTGFARITSNGMAGRFITVAVASTCGAGAGISLIMSKRQYHRQPGGIGVTRLA